MKITLVECRDKVSANCEKMFVREVKRGRPAVNCEACRETVSNPVVDRSDKVVKCSECPATFTVKFGRGRKHTKCETHRVVIAPATEVKTRQCAECEQTFTLPTGKGRKPLRCTDCRTPVKVERTDAERIDDMRAATLTNEAEESKAVKGAERALRLTEAMADLARKHGRVLINA